LFKCLFGLQIDLQFRRWDEMRWDEMRWASKILSGRGAVICPERRRLSDAVESFPDWCLRF
jgi:hypothetical protein